jgi:hypothetical protein
MQTKFISIIMTVLLLSSRLYADTNQDLLTENKNTENSEVNKDEKNNASIKGGGKFILYEGLFAANSGLAVLNPKLIGGAYLIPVPFILIDQQSTLTSRITGATLWTGICLFNIIIPDKYHYSKVKVFAYNLVGWNIFAIGTMLADSISNNTHGWFANNVYEFKISVIGDTSLLIAQYHF